MGRQRYSTVIGKSITYYFSTLSDGGVRGVGKNILKRKERREREDKGPLKWASEGG